MQNILSSRLLSTNTKIKVYRIIILHVVMNGCETWSLALREERRLRVSENRVLRRIFGLKRDEVTGSGENYIMRTLMTYSSPNIIRVLKSRRISFAGYVALMGQRKGACRVCSTMGQRKGACRVCSTYGAEERCMQGLGGGG